METIDKIMEKVFIGIEIFIIAFIFILIAILSKNNIISLVMLSVSFVVFIGAITYATGKAAEEGEKNDE